MGIVSQAHKKDTKASAAFATGTIELRKLSFPAFGTKCEVQYASSASPERDCTAFDDAVKSWVLGFQAKYSRFEPSSLVSRINDAAGKAWVQVDSDMETLLDLCDALHQMTRGLLDPTALPLMRVWDWKTRAGTTERPGDQPSPGLRLAGSTTAEIPLPTQEDIAAAMKLVGWKKVRRETGRIFLPEVGMALDFGGFGKEYAIDIVAKIAAEHGIHSALIDFGHDLSAVGAPPGRPAWHIGLEDPERPGSHRGSLAVVGKGIASSGDYLRSFVRDGRRYGHIIDPRTGRPVDNGCIQATVVAPSCLQAGVLSTTAFMLGVPEGINFIQSFPGAEGLMIRGKDRAQTRGFFNYLV